MPKSITPKLSNDSVIKFNLAMHGVKAGSSLIYGSADSALQLLIRRRLADNDGSVEIVKKETKPKNKKPTDGKGASKDKKGDN